MSTRVQIAAVWNESAGSARMRIKPIHVLTAMLALASLYFYQDPGWNGNSRLAATVAVVDRGTWQIDAYHLQPDWYTMDKSVYQGHYYTDKAIGSTLFAIPPYFILHKLSELLKIPLSSDHIKHMLTALLMGSAFVVNGILLYRIASGLTENRWKAALAALAVSLGTMLWPYSAVYYGHVPAAMFLTLAFYLLMRIRARAEAATGWAYFWPGLAIGLAFMMEYPAALVGAGLAAYGLYTVRGRRAKDVIGAAGAAALGAALPVAVMLVYNAAIYDSIFRFSYSHVAVPGFEQGLERGFMGIGMPDPAALYHFTFDPRFGIFWQSPALLLAVAGFVYGWRGKVSRPETLLAAYAIVSVFLMNAGYFMWWGGSSFGARYVIVALPFFVVPLALLPDRLLRLLGVLAAISGMQMLIPLLGGIQINVSFHADGGGFWVIQPFHGFSIMYGYGVPLIFTMLRQGISPWTLGAALGLPFQVSAAVFVAVQAVLARWLYKLSRADQSLQITA